MKRPANSLRLSTSWRIALAFAGGGFFLLLLTVGLLWLIQNRPQMPAETIVVLISILTLLVLGFAVGALGFILRSVVSQPLLHPILLALLLAYLLPAAVYFGLDRVLTARFSNLEQTLPALSLRSPLFPGQPWLFLWQALILAFLAIPAVHPLPQPVVQTGRISPPAWLSGLLGGAAIALMCAYLFSIGRAWVESTLAAAEVTQPLEIAPLIRWVTFLTGILIAPWAEERFFRGELINRWQPRLGGGGAVLASAALFATLQFRPLLWLPAFLAGVGFAWLVQAQGGLRSAIVAHTVVNLLLFALGWQWMI